MTDNQVNRQIAGLRMIVTLLAAGIVVISGGMVFTATRMNNAPVPDPLVAYAVTGFGVFMVLFNLSVAPWLVANTHKPQPGMSPVAAYAGRTLVLAGLLEGPAILLCVMFLATQSWLVLSSVPVLVMLLWLQRPSREKYDRWLERHGEPGA